MCLFLAVPGLRCCTGFPLGAGEGESSLAAALGLLTAVASLAAERGLLGVQTSGVAVCGLSTGGSWALWHRLSSHGTWA